MTTLLIALSAILSAAPTAHAPRPNIVYVLCDDLGYGDLRCLNPAGKIPTPNFDRLAAEGMALTDVHSGSSVCTPTRYGILTGRYSWRSRLQQGVLGGLSPPLIDEHRLTVARLLQQHGYYTACIGKWHLGMEWQRLAEKDVSELSIETPDQVWNVDYAKPYRRGPNAVGFDYYFGISASLDMVPYTFLENDRVTVLPTVDKVFPLMLGRPESLTRKGPAAPEFEAADVLPELIRQAVDLIRRRAAAARQGQPFFLYLPLASPHTPILPTEAWQGKSGLNPYADFVMETDAGLGEVWKALDELELADNTLVIVTSDNGCSPQAKYEELLPKGHNPSHVFRGHKADIFDGGHRIPFLVRWPGKVRAGSQSDQVLCLTDLMATCADLLDAELPPDAGVDSVSFLPVLLGTAEQPVREAVVHHSINGSFAIRQGRWKLALCGDSGGWSAPRPGTPAAGGLPLVQLYDLESDIGETKNVQSEFPEVVDRLTGLLERYVAQGRSTPGPQQSNDVEVRIRRQPAAPKAGAKKTTIRKKKQQEN